MLTPEQTAQIKKQLIENISANFPEDKKVFAIQQINSMNSLQLEEFLKKNGLIQRENFAGSESPAKQCVFCSIVSGQINSYKIDENKKALAVLEINPVSKGHIIIIPKEHLSSSGKIPQNAFSLAKSVAKKLKSKLKPQKIEISSSNVFGHEIINVVPFYREDEPSERHPAKPEELETLQNVLKKENLIPKIKKSGPKKIRTEEKIWLPKRIP